MNFPSSAGRTTTEEVGYFEVECRTLVDWLVRGLDGEWIARHTALASLADAVSRLQPGGPVSRYLCVPVSDWTLLLSNGPRGTDVGVLPSYAARELGCRAIRAVNADDTAEYPARVLVVYTPEGDPPLAIERSIVAANDGGRWVFETAGSTYPFEDLSAYTRRAISSRFTAEMVHDYLRALGVPTDADPDWTRAVTVERTR